VIESLPERFSLESLERRIREVEETSGGDQGALQVMRTIHWLASSNYESTFHGDSQVSERILFPTGPTESQGMEDARFVRFSYDDGSVTYFAPYTAYDGYRILPQLIETRDFMTFRMSTLNVARPSTRAIALFPRKVEGSFMALARLDNENNFLIRSDNVRFWHDRQLLQTPQAPWELVQLGNCGSPIETEAGWLVITHGVGPLSDLLPGRALARPARPGASDWLPARAAPVTSRGRARRLRAHVLYSCGRHAGWSLAGRALRHLRRGHARRDAAAGRTCCKPSRNTDAEQLSVQLEVLVNHAAGAEATLGPAPNGVAIERGGGVDGGRRRGRIRHEKPGNALVDHFWHGAERVRNHRRCHRPWPPRPTVRTLCEGNGVQHGRRAAQDLGTALRAHGAQVADATRRRRAAAPVRGSSARPARCRR